MAKKAQVKTQRTTASVADFIASVEDDTRRADAQRVDELGKHKTGKTCLYIDKLADVDQKVLRELAQRSWDTVTAKYR